MQHTTIPWTRNADGTPGYSWNPTSGCNGPNGVPCPYCYARAISRRFKRSFAPTCHPEKLEEPLGVKRPSVIFVDSAGDLFDPAIPSSFIEDVFGIMAITPHLTYMVLTKRPLRMAEFIRGTSHGTCVAGITDKLGDPKEHPRRFRRVVEQIGPGWPWPLPNVWLGVTAEDQAAADERIPLLLQTPAAVRFVSAEPLLGPIDLDGWLGNYWDKLGNWRETNDRLDWTIVGAQTGPGAVAPDPAWVQSIVDQCKGAGVPVWIKGAMHDTFPIEERPEVAR